MLNRVRKPLRRPFSLFVTTFLLSTALCSACCCGASSASPSKSGLSLFQVYRNALHKNETMGIQEQLLNQANELERQAQAALLPSISMNATFLRQDAPTTLIPNTQNTVKASGTQPIFRGFREFAAIRQRAALREQQLANFEDAARLLFYDVADAYYGTLALEADERNYANEIEVNKMRLKDLEGFRRVGRSRTSEVLTQRANIASLEAQLENARGQLKVQREVLAFLSGLPPYTPLSDVENAPGKAEKVDLYLEKVSGRPDLAAAQASVRSSEAAVSIARGVHWPSADLVGNYYLERPGTMSKSKWDASIVLSLPIFQGGAIQSQVRQAIAVQEQNSLFYSRAQRQAEAEVRRFFEGFVSGQAQLLKLNEFVELSRQAYEAQKKDYINGLVTNLDVLQATSSWQISLRNRERQELALMNVYVKLQAAGGKREETKVDPRDVRGSL